MTGYGLPRFGAGCFNHITSHRSGPFTFGQRPQEPVYAGGIDFERIPFAAKCLSYRTMKSAVQELDEFAFSVNSIASWKNYAGFDRKAFPDSRSSSLRLLRGHEQCARQQPRRRAVAEICGNSGLTEIHCCCGFSSNRPLTPEVSLKNAHLLLRRRIIRLNCARRTWL